MTCADVEALLIDAADGRLDLPAAVRLSTHVESCVLCRQRADLWWLLVPDMRALAPAPPDAMRARRMQIEIERQLAPGPAAPARAGGWRGARGPFALALAGAAALLLAIGLGRSKAPPPYATVVQVDGQLRGDAHALGPRSPLAAGSRIALAGGGSAELELARGSRLRIAGPALVVLGGSARDVALRLDEGRLDAEVTHRLPNETFEVVTRDLRVTVRGTRFSVATAPFDSDGSSQAGSWVRVDEGRVDVRLADGSSRSVAAGETLTSRAPDAAPAAAPGGSGAPADAAPPGPRASDATPTCAEATRACQAAARNARDRMRAGDQGAALRLLAGAARAPLPAGRGGTACGGAAVACQDELGYLRAEALRGVGRIDDAIAAYRLLDRRGAPAAMRQNALYAAAQLEHRRGKAARARADYERALAASPRGALREEAILGAMDSAVAAGDRTRAAELARRYLDAFPDGLGAARARRIGGGGRN